MTAKVLGYLKFAFRSTPPRVSMSYFGLIWNRWCTSRRFQKEEKCVLCGQEGSWDSVEHYASCEVALLLASKIMGTIWQPQDSHSSRLQFLFGIPFANKKDRLLHLIWVHVLYTLQNSSRSAGAPLSRKDLLDLSDRLLNRLSCSKGPIRKTSRECINKRKAELAALRSPDSEPLNQRRRIEMDRRHSSRARSPDVVDVRAVRRRSV